MAIYKLKNLYKLKPQYGIGKKAQKSGKYYYVRQTDIYSNNFITYVDDGPILKNNDVLICRVGINAGDSYIHTSGNNHVFAGFLVRYNFLSNKLINKFFYYWTKTKEYKNQVIQMRTGAAQPNFNPNIVGNLQINIPNVKIQKQIIDIIEPIEIQIELIQNLNQNIKKYILFRISELNRNSILKNYVEIKKYSKLIKSSQLSKENKYFYSSGKIVNLNKKTNNWNFERGLSIPYEGAGILTKSNKFFLSLHTKPLYIARKYGIITQFPHFIYYAIHNIIDASETKSLGLKMPKLTLNILNNIKIHEPSSSLENHFHFLHTSIKRIEKILKNLNKTKNNIIQMLL